MIYEAYSVLNDYSENACDLLKSVGINVTLASTSKRPDEDELVELVKKYDILIIGAREKMTSRVFNACTRTKIIGTLSVGLDHVCDDFLTSDTIEVINCPTSNTISVAEHTFALLLSLKKKIIDGNRSSIDGSGRSGVKGAPRDISGTILGVVGAGKIAKEVIKMGRAFNMKVLCNTRNPQLHNELLQYGVSFVELDELLTKSNIVTLHLPLNEQTKHIIHAEKIDLMKDTAVFLNTSRAQLVDIPYLIERATKNRKFLVGMDIDIDEYKGLFKEEISNVIITPHIAGVSLDAIIRMDYDLAFSIAEHVKGCKI